jgi:hypothetical protein
MRPTRPSGHHTSLTSPRPRGHRAVLVALVTALVLTACGRGGGGGDDIAEPDLEPGRPIEVTGRAGLVFHDLSASGTLVFPDGSDADLPIEADDAAIQAAASAIRAWLDQVLSERNRGLTTTVGASQVDAAAFAAALGVDGPATDGVLDVQVGNATYLIEIAYLGQPGWALARVESLLVATQDPGTEIARRLDTFVFAVDESGAVQFLALEVAP